MPESSITSDAIVAFRRGEMNSKRHYHIEEVKFDLVNTAAYSPRPNTAAYGLINYLKP